MDEVSLREDIPVRDVIPPSPYDMFAPLRNSRDRRVNTFDQWPINCPVSINDLVNEGFCYMGITDKVQCTHCGGVLSGWEEGDNVKDEHARHFPSCPLVQQRTDPSYLHNQDDIQPLPADAVQSITNPNVMNVRTNYAGEEFNQQYQRVGPAAPRKPIQPKYPEYALELKRIQSFKGWPSQMKQKPDILVKAGFFYMGQGDKVKCFFCGGVLWDWEPNDDVWEEHAKWFPMCTWLKITTAPNFVQDIQLRMQGLDINDQDENPSCAEMEQAQNDSNLGAVSELGKQLAAPTDDRLVQTGYGNAGQSSPTHQDNTYVKTVNDTAQDDRVVRDSIMESEAMNYDVTSSLVSHPLDEHVTSSLVSHPLDEHVTSSLVSHPLDEQALTPTSSHSSKSLFGSEQSEGTGIDTNSILEENLTLKEERICKICLDNDISMLFQPCGHLACCPSCAYSVNKCPVCRTDIIDRVKAYWQK